MHFAHAFAANAKTFYDARTGVRYSLIPRYALILTLAIVAVWSNLVLSKETLSALITLLGLLLGFGYSVQFYIAGSLVPNQRLSDSIETVADKRVLTKLSDEIYSNVAYLNLVIFAALIPPLSLMIPVPKAVSEFSGDPAWILRKAGQTALWILSLEAATTFYRVLIRSSRYFRERRALRE